MRQAFEGLAVDDAYITFRYVENALAGHGMVWNVGEPVEGYSNFLWLVLLLPLGALFGDLTTPAQLLGLLCAAVSLVVALLAMRKVLGVDSPWGALVAGLFIGTSGYVTAWSVSGLESALQGLLLVGAWARFSIEHLSTTPRRPLSAIPIVGLALLRPEGLFIALAAIALHILLCRRRGLPLRSGQTLGLPLLICLPLVAYHGFRIVTYGPHLFPNAARAKVALSLTEFGRGSSYVARNFLYPYAPLLLSAMLLRRGGKHRLTAAIGLSLIVGYLLFVSIVGGDWSYGRFFAPLLPLAVVLAVATVARWISTSPSMSGRGRRLLVLTSAVVFAALFWQVTAVDREHDFRIRFVGKDAERVAIGRWLAESAPSGTTVAVFAAGQIPYYSKLPAHDMLGLNDGHIAKVTPGDLGQGLVGHERYDVDYTFDEIHPGVIVDPQYIPGMERHPSLRRYRREPAFRRNLVLIDRELDLPPP